MKKQVLFLMGFLLPWMLCNAANDKGAFEKKRVTPIDSTISSTLGHTVADILFNPQKVVCYTVKGKDSTLSTDYVLQPHYVRDSMLAVLQWKDVAVLQFILTSDVDNYRNDSIVVKSPYLPVLEFEFVKRKAVVHVLVSLLDMTWTVMYDGKEFAHFNYANKEVIGKFCRQYYSF